MAAHHRSIEWWRKSRRWLQLTQPTHCGLCLQPLDHDAPPRTPRATEVDLIVSAAMGGAEWDEANWQAAHKSCNSSKGAGHEAKRPPLVTSREW